MKSLYWILLDLDCGTASLCYGRSGKESTMLITRTRRFTTLGLALLFAICMVSSGFAHDHGFTTIDVPGASFTQALGINPKGNVVGVYSNATGTHGFLLRRRERDDDGDKDDNGPRNTERSVSRITLAARGESP